MFVLVDLEWFGRYPRYEYITQIAAMRVDDSWEESNRFEAVLCPDELNRYAPVHMALNGYPLEAFQKGESVKTAMNRFASWLQDDDVICVWHSYAQKVLFGMWKDIFHTSIPQQILFVNHMVCRVLHAGDNTPSNLYSIAEELGVPIDLPQHCSKNDVIVMKRILAQAGISQKELCETSMTHIYGKATFPVWRNKVVIARLQYNYVYTPQSDVFHTTKCRHILNAKMIEGCMYYKTAVKKRRPCKICHPQPDEKYCKMLESQENWARKQEIRKQKLQEKKLQEKEIQEELDGSFYQDERVPVRLLGGAIVKLNKKKIIGYCHNIIHPGKMTKEIMEKHDCLGKQCSYLAKYEDAPYWVERKKKQAAKQQAKKKKKKQKAILLNEDQSLLRLQESFQSHADSSGAKMDIIRIKKINRTTYKVFYVSDNNFADGNRFPGFLEKMEKYYPYYRIKLQHIKDVDGHFVTRKEYYARKR